MKNKTSMQTMRKEAGILFAITLIAGILLGYIHELTQEPIRIQQEKAIAQACRRVFTEAAQFETISFLPGDALTQKLEEMGVKSRVVFSATDEAGNLLGFVIETISTQGYGGDISLYTGITADGTINDIALMEISETAGLGMQAEKVLVPQFHNKQVETFTYTKTGSTADSEIDAISGATITTKAVTNAVNSGLLILEELKGGAWDE